MCCSVTLRKPCLRMSSDPRQGAEVAVASEEGEAREVTQDTPVVMITVAMVTVAMEAMVAMTIVHMVAMTTAATTTTQLLGDTTALAMVQVTTTPTIRARQRQEQIRRKRKVVMEKRSAVPLLWELVDIIHTSDRLYRSGLTLTLCIH